MSGRELLFRLFLVLLELNICLYSETDRLGQRLKLLWPKTLQVLLVLLPTPIISDTPRGAYNIRIWKVEAEASANIISASPKLVCLWRWKGK